MLYGTNVVAGAAIIAHTLPKCQLNAILSDILKLKKIERQTDRQAGWLAGRKEGRPTDRL